MSHATNLEKYEASRDEAVAQITEMVKSPVALPAELALVEVAVRLAYLMGYNAGTDHSAEARGTATYTIQHLMDRLERKMK